MAKLLRLRNLAVFLTPLLVVLSIYYVINREFALVLGRSWIAWGRVVPKLAPTGQNDQEREVRAAVLVVCWAGSKCWFDCQPLVFYIIITAYHAT